MKILVAGASGFIGKALIEKLLLLEDVEIVALSRTPKRSTHPRLTWLQCDLYSLKDLLLAMNGCTQAIYLVHSMMPKSGLTQGSFFDYDLLLADNFARAALAHHIEHIIYLGGMIPKTGTLSWHLKSRLEVEETFRFTQIQVTTLRAGLVIGKDGTSFEMLKNLVVRLPFMICPLWTKTESQPVALSEILEVLVTCLVRPEVRGKIYDVGGPEVLTYQNLILKTASALGLKRKVVSFNLIPLKLSRLWVRLITGSSKDLVYPLVLSLKHRMVVSPELAWPHWKQPRVSIDEAIHEAIRHAVEPKGRAHGPAISRDVNQNEVRSIQRLIHPPGKNAEWVAQEYFNWLPSLFAFLIGVRVEGSRCTFYFIHRKISLLILEKSHERSSPDRQLLYIRGGLLVSKKMGRGRLEFREALEKSVILAAIHDFVPALPWPIYRMTQAVFHLWVMKLFDLHLKAVLKTESQG